MIHLRLRKSLIQRSQIITYISLVQISLYLILNSAPNGEALQLLSKNESTHSTTNQSTSETQRPVSDAQQQSTDLSSLYVQVPIAEPNESGGSSEAHQSDDKQSTDAADRPTKWTGSWPKKFQIGYIKQSDLHQVLIESLKGDAFTVLDGSGQQQQQQQQQPTTSNSSQAAYGTKSVPATGGSVGETPLRPLSDSASLMGAEPKPSAQPQAPVQPSSQWQRPTMSKNVYRQNRGTYGASGSMPQRFFGPHQQQQQVYNSNSNSNNKLSYGRPAPLMSQHYNMQPQQQQQHRDAYLDTRMPIAMRPTGPHQFGGPQQGAASPKLISMTGDSVGMYAPAQFQFASSSFKNQPVYSTLGGSMMQQPQIIEQQMDTLRNKQQRPSLMQAPKSYYSSWKPVVSEQPEMSVGATKSAQQQPADNQSLAGGLNDGFDDSFAMSHESQSGGDSMNRHPTLTGYLSSGGAHQQSQAKRASPSKRAKQPQQQQPATTTTTRGGSSSTKSSSDAPTGTKSKSSSGSALARGTKSSSSALPMTTSSSTTAASSPADLPTTTIAPAIIETTPSDLALANNATTTLATVPTTTLPTSQTQLVPTTTTTTQSSLGDSEPETSEPDSEVIDSADRSSSEGAANDATTQSSITTTTTTSSLSSPSSSSSSSTDGSAVEADSRSSPATGEPESSTSANEGRMREETTPLDSSSESSKVNPASPSASRAGEVEGSTVASSGASSPMSSSSSSSSSSTTTSSSSSDDASSDADLDDEALMAAAKSAEIGKASRSQQQQRNGTSAASGGSKRARSSERIVAQSNAVQSRVKSAPSSKQVKSASLQAANAKSSAGTSSTTAASAVVAAQKQRTAKQMGATKSSSSSSSSLSAGATTTTTTTTKSASLAAAKKRSSSTGATQQKQTTTTTQSRKASSSASTTTKKPINSRSRSAGAQQVKRESDRLQQTQVVSMTAAQAQSTAQTLASLLLARCLSSANCAHLLDICGTKQAAVPLQQSDTPSASASSVTTQQPLMADNANQLIGWSVPVGLMSGGLMGLAQALQADRVLRMFPAWKEAAAGVADQESQSGYTLLLPSNEALERMPSAHLDALQTNADRLQQVIEAHILDTAEQLAISTSTPTMKPKPTRVIRDARWPLQVNQHRDRHLTINGKRVIYANQLAPGGGRIHVIDGLLEWPSDQMLPLGGQTAVSTSVDTNGSGNGNNNRLLQASQPQQPMDIMETLKQCDKFDGFVTLAEGTGLTQLLKQDGPMTVFVPSNEALRKIPDDELEIIKNNATALKEFLMYHIVNGSYFSQDLRDGQQLASVLDMKPIQVGVRVDGCSRRLVEANTSPMRRPDIVASNGVIHILDWYLTVRDNYWCDSSLARATSNGLPSAPLDSAASSNAELVTMAAPSLESTRQPLRARQVATNAFDGTQSSSTQSQLQSESPAQQQQQTYSATRITPSIQSVPNNHRPTSDSGNVLGATANTSGDAAAAAFDSSTQTAAAQATPVAQQLPGERYSAADSSDKVARNAVVSDAA